MMEAWLHLQGFLDILLTRNVLAELAALAACLGLGWAAAVLLRHHERFRGVSRFASLGGVDLLAYIALTIVPAVSVLGLVLLARTASSRLCTSTITILDASLRLVAAYVVIRVGVLLFATSLGNKSWMQNLEGRVTLLIWLAFAADYLSWLDPIVSVLDEIGINSGKSHITVWSVMKLLFTLTLFVLVAAWISRWIDRRLKKLHTLAPSTRIGLAKFSNAFLIGLSILVGLNTAGVDLTTLTVLTGGIGVGLGFGLQSIASNFVSGFVLLMDRSIKPGDVISLSGQSGTSTENFGWVQELRGRYVVIRDRDGIEMLVPNQQLIQNAVINWSYTDPRIRLKLPVRVSYQNDPELALKILLEACEGQRRVLRDPPPVSRLMQFGDHGIELELRFWISDPQEGVNNVRSEVNRTIWALFKEHNITIPVAQREITFHNAPPELD